MMKNQLIVISLVLNSLVEAWARENWWRFILSPYRLYRSLQHLTLSLPSLRPLLCYRLSHYDHCYSFLVLLGLLADKLSVMEMGRKGSERRPIARKCIKKKNSFENYGNRLIWTYDRLKLLPLSAPFLFFFLILSGWMPTGYWRQVVLEISNRQADEQ